MSYEKQEKKNKKTKKKEIKFPTARVEPRASEV